MHHHDLCAKQFSQRLQIGPQHDIKHMKLIKSRDVPKDCPIT